MVIKLCHLYDELRRSCDKPMSFLMQDRARANSLVSVSARHSVILDTRPDQLYRSSTIVIPDLKAATVRH
jgi:hypothetical protein